MTTTRDGAGRALPDQGDAPRERTAADGRAGWRTVAGLVGAAAVMAAATWWWTHPTVYGGVGGEFGARPERLEPVYVDMGVSPDEGDVTLLRAEPRVEVFGAAHAEVMVCSGAGIGILYGDDAGQGCSPLIGPTRPGTWDQVVLRVVPESPDTVVVVDGVDLDYRTGLQSGVEHTGQAGVVVFPSG